MAVDALVIFAAVTLLAALAGCACAVREITCPPRARRGVLVIDP